MKEFATRFSKKCSGSRTNKNCRIEFKTSTHKKVFIFFHSTMEQPPSAKTAALFASFDNAVSRNGMILFTPFLLPFHSTRNLAGLGSWMSLFYCLPFLSCIIVFSTSRQMRCTRNCCCPCCLNSKATDKTETSSVERYLQYWKRGAGSFWWHLVQPASVSQNLSTCAKISTKQELSTFASTVDCGKRVLKHSHFFILIVDGKVCYDQLYENGAVKFDLTSDKRTCASIKPFLWSIPRILHSRLMPR